jgi:hypothetical protein
MRLRVSSNVMHLAMYEDSRVHLVVPETPLRWHGSVLTF